MDKKKKIGFSRKCILLVATLITLTMHLWAQDVKKIQLCDKKYEYGVGKDSITLYLKVIDSDGNRSRDVSLQDLNRYLVIYEDGNLISNNQRTIRSLNSGMRIPSDYTFSVLVDQSIPADGKRQIYEAIGKLVDSAPDSTVYLSFFGEAVTATQMITSHNYRDLQPLFQNNSTDRHLYDALYAKLSEIGGDKDSLLSAINVEPNYSVNTNVTVRATANPDKTLLLVFIEGHNSLELTDRLSYISVTDYQRSQTHIAPKVFAFYYGNKINEDLELTLKGITDGYGNDNKPIPGRQGGYTQSNDLGEVLAGFEQVVQDAMYDFALTYRATEGKIYNGNTTYKIEWKGEELGNGTFSIGTAENPWPTVEETTTDTIMKYLVAVIVTLLTIVLFFLVMKVLIPLIKSRAFKLKYYKKYVPQANIKKRICPYCKQEIQPGQMVVAKCEHIMHVHCWKQNDYRCAEYGQNCKTGIQERVDWHSLFNKNNLRDCHQMIAGVLASLVSWIIYELMGRGAFTSLSNGIVNTFILGDEQQINILHDTATIKVSAFLTIGLLLGFFLSLIFRYNDEYRNKDFRICLKIFSLSFLSGIIGFAAFAVGAIIFCLLLSVAGTTYIPWYCSLPAYLLFSAGFSLSLTIRSSIPVKSAIIGSMCSAVIGFIVLYFSSLASATYSWMTVLLDFVIFGGGLGASLVTVRMLAEKYFLDIKNGIKAGQRIPIHKWMNATGGGNKVTIGMTNDCEIQMNWEKSNKVAKEHAQLYIDPTRLLPVIKPLATGVIYNTRAELPMGKPTVLSNGDTFKIGDTIFQYVETD